jgi:4-hydroxy-tetrahydrodipicolinate synthase
MTVASFSLIIIGISVGLLASKVSALRGGSVVALVTPMKADRSIDYGRLVDLLNWHVSEGTDGVVILGTTGEGSTTSFDERTEVIKTAVSTIKGAMPVIVGTGTIEPNKVIELTKQAKDLKADASLVITPYYVKPPQRALVSHFTSIVEAVALPLIAYNCPGRTGVDMKPETIALMAKHPLIVGVKDATGDLTRVKSIREGCGEKFLIYSGEDDSGCEFVKIGGDGVISVTANVAPKAMHQMLSLSKQGKEAEAQKINDMLMPLHKRLFLESNPIPAKKALQIMGKIDGAIRPPLVELDPVHLPALQEALMIGKAI